MCCNESDDLARRLFFACRSAAHAAQQRTIAHVLSLSAQLTGARLHRQQTVDKRRQVRQVTGIDLPVSQHLTARLNRLPQPHHQLAKRRYRARLLTHLARTNQPMAAGQLRPFQGLAFAWSTLRDIDMVTVGTMTPGEAAEVIEISLNLLEKKQPGQALQETRSKGAVKKPLSIL